MRKCRVNSNISFPRIAKPGGIDLWLARPRLASELFRGTNPTRITTNLNQRKGLTYVASTSSAQKI